MGGSDSMCVVSCFCAWKYHGFREIKTVRSVSHSRGPPQARNRADNGAYGDLPRRHRRRSRP